MEEKDLDIAEERRQKNLKRCRHGRGMEVNDVDFAEEWRRKI